MEDISYLSCYKDYIVQLYDYGYSLSFIIKDVYRKVNTRQKFVNRFSGGSLFVFIRDKYCTRKEVSAFVYGTILAYRLLTS